MTPPSVLSSATVQRKSTMARHVHGRSFASAARRLGPWFVTTGSRFVANRYAARERIEDNAVSRD